jgi:hypothetical protein
MTLILTLEDDSDPYKFTARAVQRNETQWDVEYFRDGVLCADGGIGTPPPNLPPVATLKSTLEQLRQEAGYWAARGK